MVSVHANGDVEFSFFRPGVHRVFVLGDFNKWGKPTLPMRPADRGWWRCRLPLAPGIYQFKYLADGQWYLDYAAFGLERGPLGEWNSVVVVTPGPVRERRVAAAQAAPSIDLALASHPLGVSSTARRQAAPELTTCGR